MNADECTPIAADEIGAFARIVAIGSPVNPSAGVGVVSAFIGAFNAVMG